MSDVTPAPPATHEVLKKFGDVALTIAELLAAHPELDKLLVSLLQSAMARDSK